ncbi:carbonic anhydrase [Sulfurospirillum sp. 1612]|uniref:carbonic anhydrase n=1 Tax=Sulfurospirillum sp. 1612 TaxID=3094835 RepID=UPI002F954CE0
MDISMLMRGTEAFKKQSFKKYKERYIDLVKRGQKPKALFIGCSDSRVVPSLITNSDPGDLFVVRNIGNFVPPYKPDVDFHGTAAAIEYAVSFLKVSDIIVCGHSHCGAIEGVFKKEDIDPDAMIHVKKWLELGERTKEMIDQLEVSEPLELKLKMEMAEQISVVFSLQNLLSYPKVAEKVEEGTLSIRGWYYKIETGDVSFYDDDKMLFLPPEHHDA